MMLKMAATFGCSGRIMLSIVWIFLAADISKSDFLYFENISYANLTYIGPNNYIAKVDDFNRKYYQSFTNLNGEVDVDIHGVATAFNNDVIHRIPTIDSHIIYGKETIYSIPMIEENIVASMSNSSLYAECILDHVDGSYQFMHDVLRLTGEMDTSIVDLLIQLIETADVHKQKGNHGAYVIIDVGSYLGTWTIPLAKHFIPRYSNTKVISFDASASINAHLKTSLRLNGFNDEVKTGKITTITAIVSNIKGCGRQSNNSIEIASTSSCDPKLDDHMQVPMVYLDAYYNKGTFSCPSFIRFDIDLHEFQAILGAEKILMHCRPLIFISVPCESLTRSYVKYLSHLGYDLAWTGAPSLSNAILDYYSTGNRYAQAQFDAIIKNQRLFGGPYLVGIPRSQKALFGYITLFFRIPPSEYDVNLILANGRVEVRHYGISCHVRNRSYTLSQISNTSNCSRCSLLTDFEVFYWLRLINRSFTVDHEKLQPYYGTDPTASRSISGLLIGHGHNDLRRTSEGHLHILGGLSDLLYFRSAEDERDANRVMFISGFYDIKRESWNDRNFQRSLDDYLAYFKPFLLLDIDMLLFVHEHVVPRIIDIANSLQEQSLFRINLNILSINESFLAEHTLSFNYFTKEEAILNSEQFKSSPHAKATICQECKSAHYNIAVHLKSDFVSLALTHFYREWDTSSNIKMVYSWIDFGFFKWYEDIPSRPINADYLRSGRLHINAFNPVILFDQSSPPGESIELIYPINYHDHLNSAMLAGTRDAMLWFTRGYHYVLNYYFYANSLTANDQGILLQMMVMYRDNFEIVFTHSCGSMLKFLQVNRAD